MNATADWPTWPQWTDADLEAVRQTLDSGRWGGVDAPAVTRFEDRWRTYTESRHALAASNGTDTLLLALKALGIGQGDEVIVPPYTFIATATAVQLAGATPVFADVDEASYCLDPATTEAAITPRTRAVIAVHLAGHPADMDGLGAVCERHGLALIEDAAHAHGARHRGSAGERAVGAIGTVGSWSFQGSKNLTGGEGGALTTNDDQLATTLDSLRNQGRSQGGGWYDHALLGWNSRMTAMQAALLGSALDRLPAQVEAREATAAVLDARLPELDAIDVQGRADWVATHAHHLYLVRYRGDRPLADVVADVRALGVPASVGYPRPLYAQQLFAADRPAADLPVSERVCRETIWLPHALLLAAPERMDEVVAAFEKAAR